ncbi:solute carrier family 23 protein [Dictyobacter arantiisoli]|uniref:Nitrate reductase n=1 Tax=Dictyobacter arantiisoli TaxID=2014874 RepID=A0A5A5T7E9_9CHLR|nr:solute carrier family 23 protein [Dictyobacter arantiisoli]GCF07400.1 nitrate reductase [Dictyobacter arantiisoli]
MGVLKNNHRVVAEEQRSKSYFPQWKVKTSGIVGPDERLPWGPTILVGLQHVLAMFGSTVFAPLAMGFDPNTAIFFSGIGTLIFFLIVGGRVPSYLGSSFAFIGVVVAATGYHATAGGLNPNIPVALGGIVTVGIIYAIVAIIVILVGSKWVEVLMPPVVTGAVVASIGLNLAGAAIGQATGSAFAGWMAAVTVIAVAMVAVYAPGSLRRLSILIGGIIGYVVNLILSLVGIGPHFDFSKVSAAAWIGLPHFETPKFTGSAMTLIAPVVIILIAENIGHVRAVSSMTDRNLDKYLGRAFLGDAVATVVAGSGGGTGVTTYAENIGVMAVTRIYSTLIFVVASAVAILLGFCPKFGAIISTIPTGVFGGLSIVLFGLIAISGARIWVENKVDFSKSRNLLTAGVSVIIGSGMVGGIVVKFGNITFDGIGVATFSAIVLYQILRERTALPEEATAADAAVGVDPTAESDARL